jgi:hypothetical protein
MGNAEFILSSALYRATWLSSHSSCVPLRKRPLGAQGKSMGRLRTSLNVRWLQKSLSLPGIEPLSPLYWESQLTQLVIYSGSNEFKTVIIFSSSGLGHHAVWWRILTLRREYTTFILGRSVLNMAKYCCEGMIQENPYVLCCFWIQPTTSFEVAPYR